MKKRLHRIIPIVLLSLLTAACSKQEPEHEGGKPAGLSQEEPTGAALFEQRCRDCHKVQDKGGTVGPDLSRIGSKRSATYLEQVIREPSKVYPGTVMPPNDTLSRKQVNSLVDYLSTLK